MEWVDSLPDELPDGDGVHVDGKCLRRAFGNDGRQPCIVSAYSSKDRIVIGQVKADEKSNEITAIPDLLRRLYLTGAIVTIDAAGCQKKIASGSASRSVSVSSSQPSAASKRGLKRPPILAADGWQLVAETLGRRPTEPISSRILKRRRGMDAWRPGRAGRPIILNGSRTGGNGPA